MPNTRKRVSNKRNITHRKKPHKDGHIHKTNIKGTVMKKKQCSPKKKGELLDFTCFTPNALGRLKVVWNTRHPDQTVDSNSPKEIWKQLKKYMQETCSSESCWLKHQCIKHDLDKSLWEKMFAPHSPEKWKENPNEWLTTVEIQKIMGQWEKARPSFEFLGPSPVDYDEHVVFGECVWEELCKFSLDECKKKGTSKIGIIFNLDKHTQPGSHWVAVFMDLKKHKIYYFDSYGDNMPKRILKFCENVKRQGSNFKEKYEIYVSKKRHQYGNSECGMFSMFFILQMLEGTMFNTFQKIRIKDSEMVTLRKEYFNSR